MKINKYIKNANWIMLYQIISLLYTVSIGAYMIRSMGPEHYGMFEYAKAIIDILITICGLGIDNIIVVQLTKHEKSQYEVMGTALLMKFCMGILFFTLIVLWIITKKNILAQDLYITLYSFILLVNYSSTIKEFFLFRLKSKWMFIFDTSSLLVVSFYVVVIAIKKYSVFLYAFTPFLQAFVTFFLVVIYIHFVEKKTFFCFKKQYIIDFIKGSMAFVCADLAIIAYNHIDKLMLKHMMGSETVGIYSVAVFWGTIWQSAPLAFVTSAKPIIVKKTQEGLKFDAKLMTKKVLNLVAFLCLSMVIFLQLFGKHFIYFQYGVEYIEAYKYLLPISLSVFFSMIGCIESIYLVAFEVYKYSAYRTVSGVVINCILNYLLIKRYGILGAAIATLITQIFVSSVFLLLFKETRRILKCMVGSLFIKKKI